MDVSSKVRNSNFSTMAWEKWAPFSGIALPSSQTAALTVSSCTLPSQPLQGWRMGQGSAHQSFAPDATNHGKAPTPLQREPTWSEPCQPLTAGPGFEQDPARACEQGLSVPKALMLVCLWKSCLCVLLCHPALDAPSNIYSWGTALMLLLGCVTANSLFIWIKMSYGGEATAVLLFKSR